MLPIQIDKRKISDFCRRWHVVEFSLFGSAVREDFKPDSDVDVLVSFEENAPISLFDMAQMQIELEDLFDRPVDLVEKEGLRNPYRRESILSSAQVLYVAG